MSDMYGIDSDYSINNLFADFLNPDESIMWSGKPQEGRLIQKEDKFVIPFSIFWFGFALFWTVTATAMGGAFGLFGIPFLIFGYYLVFGRFRSAKKFKNNTYYAITNKRVIIMQRLNTISVKDYNIKELGKIELELYSDGNGNIKFNSVDNYREYDFARRGNIADSRGLYERNFINIKNAKKVYDMLQENKEI